MAFTAPTVTGGTEPVSVACTPASGSAFPLGTTAVSCVATDASARLASCSFNVVVSGVQFPVKKFLAVGDSLTAGENGSPLSYRPVVDEPNSYPTKLQALFDGMFRARPALNAPRPDAVEALRSEGQINNIST